MDQYYRMVGTSESDNGFIPVEVNEISDGYHTFPELYDYRLIYNAALFNEWARYSQLGGSDAWWLLHDVHKSWKHYDGEPCFGGGWFIVVAELPSGQISNHYKAEHWDLFKIPEKEIPNEYDGHTPQEAAQRLRAYLEAG